MKNIEDTYKYWISNSLRDVKWTEFQYGSCDIAAIVSDAKAGLLVGGYTEDELTVHSIATHYINRRYGNVSDMLAITEHIAYCKSKIDQLYDLLIVIVKVRYLLGEKNHIWLGWADEFRFISLGAYMTKDDITPNKRSDITNKVQEHWMGSNAQMSNVLKACLGLGAMAKYHGGYKSKHTDIQRGLDYLRDVINDANMSSMMLGYMQISPSDPWSIMVQHRPRLMELFTPPALCYLYKHQLLIDRISNRMFRRLVDYFTDATITPDILYGCAKRILEVSKQAKRKISIMDIEDYICAMGIEGDLSILENCPIKDLELPWYIWVLFLALTANTASIAFKLNLNSLERDIEQWTI